MIDHEKCCYCLLCVIVCPTNAFHENIEPEGHISLDEYPSIGKFYRIDMDKCIEDNANEICKLCLNVRDRNQIKEYYKISKECPTKCFFIDSPITGEVLIKKNMLHKCDPQGCKACVNICPVESFFIPETAEDVLKYGKIACNEEQCFYCGACENSCPDDLIVVNRKEIKILDPKKSGNFPWIEAWLKNIKRVLREALIEGKEQIALPTVEETIEKAKKEQLLKIPQLSEKEKKQFNEINQKVQQLLNSSKIRYWIKDKKTNKVAEELRKALSS